MLGDEKQSKELQEGPRQQFTMTPLIRSLGMALFREWSPSMDLGFENVFSCRIETTRCAVVVFHQEHTALDCISQAEADMSRTSIRERPDPEAALPSMRAVQLTYSERLEQCFRLASRHII